MFYSFYIVLYFLVNIVTYSLTYVTKPIIIHQGQLASLNNVMYASNGFQSDSSTVNNKGFGPKKDVDRKLLQKKLNKEISPSTFELQNLGASLPKIPAKSSSPNPELTQIINILSSTEEMTPSPPPQEVSITTSTPEIIIDTNTVTIVTNTATQSSGQSVSTQSVIRKSTAKPDFAMFKSMKRSITNSLHPAPIKTVPVVVSEEFSTPYTADIASSVVTQSQTVAAVVTIANSNSNIVTADYALLFDCDGVIVETEELHRLAYNEAFAAFGIQLPDGTPVIWDVEYYDKLQNTVGGGKPKMKYYFTTDVKTWPIQTIPTMKTIPINKEDQDKLIDDLQDAKTEFYKILLEKVAKPRPGILELMDEALLDPRIKVGVCSAATKGGFIKVVDTILGKDRLSKLDIILAGDDVSEKKPSPMIYNKARESIQIAAEKCIVVEDSLVGLKAAKAAGMRCIITYTESTKSVDFYKEGADAKLPNLAKVTLKDIFDPLRKGSCDLLVSFKDPVVFLIPPTVTQVPPTLSTYKGWTPHYMISKL